MDLLGKMGMPIQMSLDNCNKNILKAPVVPATSMVGPHWFAFRFCSKSYFSTSLVNCFRLSLSSYLLYKLALTICIYNRCLLLLLYTFFPLLFTLLIPLPQSSSFSSSSSSPPIVRADLPPLLEGGRFFLICAV